MKRAIAFGQLFALPFGYPAMTPGESIVKGFLLSFPSSAVLHDLDWLEDFDSHRPRDQNEYNRQLIETYNSDIPLRTAWVYLMSVKRVHSCGGVFLPDGWWSGSGLSPHHALDNSN